MHSILQRLSFALLGILISACSDDPKPDQTPVKPFTTETQALEQAKQLEQSMLDAANLQRQKINDQLN